MCLSPEDCHVIVVCHSNYRSDDDHYEHPIPYTDDTSTMPKNIHQSLPCLKSIDLLLTMIWLLYHYNEYMPKPIHRGYAKVVTLHMVSEPDKKYWFIPHHEVRKG